MNEVPHSGVAAMAWSGFTVAVLVPAVVAATRRSPFWRLVALPAGVALPLFVVVHAVASLGGFVAPLGAVGRGVLEAVLLCAAFVFWLPVLGTSRRLGEAGRCVYLFLAAPLLDLPAVGMIAAGHGAGGLAMIVSMLPMGVLAMGVTWRWVVDEERAQEEGLPPRGRRTA